MSRIGKLPIVIPEGVNVEMNGLTINVSGPKGKLSKTFKGDINIYISDNRIIIEPLNKDKYTRSIWGTARSIIASMIKGVKENFVKELEANGVGYKVSVSGNYLNLSVGKSHNTKIQIPTHIKVETPKPTVILLSGVNKEEIGRFASLIKQQRPVEPYKGKGIRGKDDFVERKEGKKN